MTETIKFKRSEAPYEIIIGMHTPDDGFHLTDVQYVEMDGKRLEPVSDEYATPLLASLAQFTNALTDMVGEFKSDVIADIPPSDTSDGELDDGR